MNNNFSGKAVEAAFFSAAVMTISDRVRISKVIKNVEQGVLDKPTKSEWSITFKDLPITYQLADNLLTTSQSEYLSHMWTESRTKK